MRILVVEDEKNIASFIERGLKEQHYAVDVALDGALASSLAEVNDYDLVILDGMLPGKDGFALCQEMRASKPNILILMVTARYSVKDKVRGLESGADDYLTKPFAFEELLARVAALLRRKSVKKTNILSVGDLELDQLKHTAKRAGKDIALTSKEYALLEYMMLNAGDVVTRTMITEHVWNEDFDSFSNVIDVYINHLRNKVDKEFKKPLIHSVRGTGYVLKE